MFVHTVVIENFKRFKGKHAFEFTDGLNILVGDNEIGKSTVLEAVHLALTGYYHGNRIERELSQYLFNKEATDEWLKNKNTPLPEIFIEVFLGGCEDEMLKGNFNSDRDGNAFGIRFSIVFNDEYKEEYEKISGEKKISSLPVEYYKIQWETFARERITTRSVPIKSSLIDTSEYRYGNASDAYVSEIIKNHLEGSERPQIAQAYRELKEKFGDNEIIDSINEKLRKETGKLWKETTKLQGETKLRDETKSAGEPKTVPVFPTVAVDMGTANAWEKSLIVELKNIPLPYRGKGCQKMVKTELALLKKKSENADIILLEEPENHLSFSKLNQLVKYISDRCSEKQIIVSTHSTFVANKLGLNKLILLSENRCMRMTDLEEPTADYFKKLPGYDTLRLILCQKAILVEGPSDELIVQRAYMDNNNGHLPIDDGIDVISVGALSFKRFLEIAEKLKLKDVRVVTDNDGHPEKVEETYGNYLGKNKKEGISIFFTENSNLNTLEPNLVKADPSNAEALNKIFGKPHKNEDELIEYMKNKKTACALAIFESEKIKIEYPEYIQNAVDFGNQER